MMPPIEGLADHPELAGVAEAFEQRGRVAMLRTIVKALRGAPGRRYPRFPRGAPRGRGDTDTTPNPPGRVSAARAGPRMREMTPASVDGSRRSLKSIDDALVAID